MRFVRRAGGAIFAALLAVGPSLATGSPAAAAPAPSGLGPSSVQVSVLSVNPSTPAAAATAQPLVVRLKLTNTTAHALAKLHVEGSRGDPINNQQALDAAMANPSAPDPELAGRFAATPAATISLPAYSSATIDYASSASPPGVTGGLCLCQSRIYPLYFTVHYQPTGSPDTVVGTGETFVPSFPLGDLPKPVQVSWVWPILEPPHRSLSDDVFTDDSLATSVAGGRLDRLLQVVQNVGGTVPITVLIDPDLLDELAVMATGHYEVATTDGHTVPGKGADAARTWLQRLAGVLAADPDVQLAFTAYADPDVEALNRNGLDWSGALPSAALARVSAVLNGHQASTDLTWPVGSTLSAPTLQSLARRGTSVVLVDDNTLPQRDDSPPQNALQRVRTSAGTVTAAVTSTSIEQYVGAVVALGGTGLGSLPQLVSEVAIRAVEDGSRSHFVTITPPRYVDPDPVAATRAILDTAHTSWSTGLTLHAAVAAVTPAGYGKLVPQQTGGGLPQSTIGTARYADAALPTLTGLITDATDAEQAFGDLPEAIQRSESSAWHATPGRSAALAATIRARVSHLMDGVHLVRPSTGSYTFGSSDAPLPVTVTNTLDYPVQVRLDISTVGGLAGFTPKDIGVKTLQPHTTVPLHVPSHIDPVRRIKVQVQLMTAADAPIGGALKLSVRSTALGTVGKIITFAAAAVLAVALLLRLYRRLRRRRRNRSVASTAGSPATAAGSPKPVA